MKYRLDDIKDITDFVYRESLPDNPDAGTFYWIEDGNDVALYFADSRCNLIRLDNRNSSDISEDDLSDELKKKINRIISETDLDGNLKKKINRIISETDLDGNLKNKINRIISETDFDDNLKNKINRIISETDLDDNLKNKINRIVDSYDSLSELTDDEVDEIFEDIFIKGEY